MRFFEINDPNTQAVPPIDATKEPHPADKQPAAPAQLKAKVKRKGDGPFVINDVTYANRTDQDAEVAAIKAALIDEFPSVNVRNDLEDINAGKKIPSIRILNALPRDKVLGVLKDAGYQLANTKNDVQIVSGTYQNFIYTFTKNNIVFTVVIAGKGAGEGQEGKCQVGIQMLRP